MQTLPKLVIATSVLILCTACGGGSTTTTQNSSSVVPPPVLSLQGTVAAPMAQANLDVKIKCGGANGSVKTDANGQYQIKLDNGKLPCVFEVNTPNSSFSTLHSIALGTGTEAVANITPLTELTLARAAQKKPDLLFADYNASQSTIDTQKLAQAFIEVRGVLSDMASPWDVKNYFSTPLLASTTQTPSKDDYARLLEALAPYLSPTMFNSLSSILSSGLPLPDPQPFFPRLDLAVGSLALGVGEQYEFVANLNFAFGVQANVFKRQPIHWEVVEQDGGNISSDGRYIAPNKPGVYHVKATREDFSSVSVTIEIQVGAYRRLSYISLASVSPTDRQVAAAVLRNAQTWQQWAINLPLQDAQVPAVPTLDFAKEMLVVLPSYSSNSCGGIDLLDAQEIGGRLVIRYRKTPVPLTLNCAQAFSNRVAVFAIAQSNLQVDFSLVQ